MQTFTPVRLPRAMEFVTWALAVIVLGAWWVLQANQASFAGTAVLLFIFLFFAAFGISLSGWMDRNTLLRLDEESVFFRNGLRTVHLQWPQVQKVRVLAAQAGSKRIQVLAEKAYFEFRTLAVLEFNGKERGRSGFEDGEQILETILGRANLVEQEASAAYRYYARE